VFLECIHVSPGGGVINYCNNYINADISSLSYTTVVYSAKPSLLKGIGKKLATPVTEKVLHLGDGSSNVKLIVTYRGILFSPA